MSGNELSRQGGLPPMVMVFEGAVVTLTDNTIRGGGVAGIRVAGTVFANDNRVLGAAPAAEVRPTSASGRCPAPASTLTGNEIRAWRTRPARHAGAGDGNRQPSRRILPTRPG